MIGGKMVEYREEDYPEKELTGKIIGAAFRVHNRLGGGFIEKVYENALANELRKIGLTVYQQVSMKVLDEGLPVGQFIADCVVENLVLLELKATKELEKSHEEKLTHYLKSTGIEIGLLINFGSSVQVKRRVFTRNKH